MDRSIAATLPRNRGEGTWVPGGALAVATTVVAGAAVVVTAFLIRHPSGPVLLDTGLAVGHAEAENLYHPVRRPFDGVLADAGVRPAEVKVVANCHLHLDHSGNNFRFPGVPIIVATLANGSRPTYLPTAETYGKGIYQESIALLAAGSLEKVIDAVGRQIDEWIA